MTCRNGMAESAEIFPFESLSDQQLSEEQKQFKILQLLEHESRNENIKLRLTASLACNITVLNSHWLFSVSDVSL